MAELLASRYELGPILGEGSSGKVYRAWDSILGRDVAIKMMSKAPSDEHELAVVLREARVAAHFRHPNACEIYAVDTANGLPYMVMELVRGKSLAAELADGTFPFDSVLFIAQGMADVLVAAHSIGLVHRDLKPQNVMFQGTREHPSRVRLIDFGLAFLIEPSSQALGRLTKADMITGTPCYMAPEQIEARNITAATDIYALGCLLYEVATGRTPFLGSLNKILTGHLYLPPIAPSELMSALPVSFDALITTMLAKDPTARPSAVQVNIALAAMVAGESVRSAVGRTRSAPTGPHRIRTTPRIALLRDEPGLVEELQRLGIVLSTNPEVYLVTLPENGIPDFEVPTEIPVIGLLSHSSNIVVKNAIRGGLSMIVRWPTTRDELLERLVRFGHTADIPRG
ncbi:MAG: serine/threonine-protein kinase [Kofleriaceae bacterium]